MLFPGIILLLSTSPFPITEVSAPWSKPPPLSPEVLFSLVAPQYASCAAIEGDSSMRENCPCTPLRRLCVSCPHCFLLHPHFPPHAPNPSFLSSCPSWKTQIKYFWQLLIKPTPSLGPLHHPLPPPTQPFIFWVLPWLIPRVLLQLFFPPHAQPALSTLVYHRTLFKNCSTEYSTQTAQGELTDRLIAARNYQHSIPPFDDSMRLEFNLEMTPWDWIITLGGHIITFLPTPPLFSAFTSHRYNLTKRKWNVDFFCCSFVCVFLRK